MDINTDVTRISLAISKGDYNDVRAIVSVLSYEYKQMILGRLSTNKQRIFEQLAF